MKVRYSDVSAITHSKFLIKLFFRYFGAKRGGPGATDERQLYSDLRKLLTAELRDTTVRSPRSVSLIYKAFQVLCSWDFQTFSRVVNVSYRMNKI